MNSTVKARLEWVQLFEQTKDAGLVCRRCGISRPTLRKWVKRFQQHSAAGLEDQSRRPKALRWQPTWMLLANSFRG